MAITKIFGGKRYSVKTYAPNKQIANRLAKQYRSQGFAIRIVPNVRSKGSVQMGLKYRLFARKKK